MTDRAFRDYYPDDYSHCYGCGRLNDQGHQIKSYWDGEESICHLNKILYHSPVSIFFFRFKAVNGGITRDALVANA